jgi:hypothetical protein
MNPPVNYVRMKLIAVDFTFNRFPALHFLVRHISVAMFFKLAVSKEKPIKNDLGTNENKTCTAT